TIGPEPDGPMNLYLPRFRLRTLMIAVAIAGLACGGEALRRRRAYCLEQASKLAMYRAGRIQDAEIWRFQARQALARARDQSQRGNTDNAKAWVEHADRYANLGDQFLRAAERLESRRLKYERLARYPWLPVEPDPPMPE